MAFEPSHTPVLAHSSGQKLQTTLHILATERPADLSIVPDDSWQNKESRLDHLQPFGCQVFFYRDHRNPSKLAPRYKERLLMGFVDGTHNYHIWDTKSNSVITSRDVVFTHSPTTSDPVGPEIMQVPDDDIIETTEMPVSPQRQLLRQFSRIDQQETLRPIPDNIDDDDPLNLQPLDEGGIDPHFFSAHALLAAQQHHNHIYKPVTQASGSSGSQRCKKSLQRWTNTKSGKSSLDHPICASWEHVGCLLERLMEKPANHRHTKLDGLPKDSVKSRELISTTLLQLHT